MSAMEQPRVSPDLLVRRAKGSTSQGGTATSGDSIARTPSGSRFALPARSVIAVSTVVGGLAGAVFAVVAVLAMTELRPPLDPRLPGLAQQVGGFQQSLYDLETAVRSSEVDLVRALAADAALATRLDEQAGSVDTAMAEIAEARRQVQVETGPGSVVFGVSVVQLANAISAGRPFESEWVNLYVLGEGDETVREPLRRLMAVAVDGVPTLAVLRDNLRATAAAAGTPVVDPDNLYLYGLNALQSGLGVPIGTTAELQVVSGLVSEADRRLAEGDLAAALAAMGNLTESAGAPFQTWIVKARRRLAADAATTELTRSSREALKARAKGGSG